MCGNCCTGAPGFVKFTPEEGRAIAVRLGVSEDEFLAEYARDTPAGRSLREVRTRHGYDCVFLDRQRVAGKAVCSLYEDRPMQCRTWPFWSSNLKSERDWEATSRNCPGIGTGPLYDPAYIRMTRDRVEI